MGYTGVGGILGHPVTLRMGQYPVVPMGYWDTIPLGYRGGAVPLSALHHTGNNAILGILSQWDNIPMGYRPLGGAIHALCTRQGLHYWDIIPLSHYPIGIQGVYRVHMGAYSMHQ